MATICFHIVEVLLSPYMGIEELEVCESLYPSVKGLKNCKGDSGGKMSYSSSIKIDVINVSGHNTPGGIDDSVKTFGWCEIEV